MENRAGSPSQSTHSAEMQPNIEEKGNSAAEPHGLGAQPSSTSPGMTTAQDDFDEYGAELGPEARVWKTYVREADRFDSEKVDEWNRSLDVILIFAALFSTISTAFVIESTNLLKEDPADVSAKTLALISQTLIAIANNSQPLPSSNSAAPTSEEFASTRSAVCVNILWFLSLSLSVAVSLIAMLAKEWCHIFMSGRTGNLGVQAKRRQARFQALERWKMAEVLMFLPSLIHLALLLFAVGLCIYLWDIHLAVAIPVVIVTILASSIYAVSTLLPFWHKLCPYSTTGSRFIMALRQTLTKAKKITEESWRQDKVVGNALRWLIEQCETPQSVAVALQAIAGADEDLPLDPLKESRGDAVFELYARGFAILHPPTNNPDRAPEIYNNVNALRRKIMRLQDVMERTVVDQFATQELFPTRLNLLALRIGSRAASCCLQSLAYENQSPLLEALEPATELLLVFADNADSLHPAALHSLFIGTGMLLSCSLVHGKPLAVAPYVLRLLRSLNWNHPAHFGILYTALAFAQCDHPGWVHPAPLGPAARAERAIETVTYYAPLPGHSIGKGPLCLGLVEFLLHPTEYNLDVEDITILSNLLCSGARPSYRKPLPFSRIPTLPRSFNQWVHTSRAFDNLFSSPEQLKRIQESQACVQAILGVLLLSEMTSPDKRVPALEAYIFVVETLAYNPDDQKSLTLICRYYDVPHCSPKLASLAHTRNIIPLLVNALESTNHKARCFATAQLLLFTKLALHSSRESSEASVPFGDWFQYEERCNPRKRLEAVEESLGGSLSGLTKGATFWELHYAGRVLNHIPSPPFRT